MVLAVIDFGSGRTKCDLHYAQTLETAGAIEFVDTDEIEGTTYYHYRRV